MSTKKKGIRLENHVFELCAGNLERKLHNPQSRLRVAERLVELAKEQVEDDDNSVIVMTASELGGDDDEQGDLPL